MMVYTAESNVALLGDGTEDGAWQAAYAAPMEYPTGQGYAYTQTNYALLGRIIEQLSGTSFADFVARRQFAVADMPHTRFFTDQDIVPRSEEHTSELQSLMRISYAVFCLQKQL